MPNDLPDWTAKVAVNLVGGISQLNLGDVGAPSLNPDSGTESVNSGGGPPFGNTLILASFKAAAGLVIAQAGALGAFATGTGGVVNPAFGQATVAGHMLLAWVGSSAAEPTTAAAGWVKVVSVNTNGAWAALWAKPNCGAAEAAPGFTSAGGVEKMYAQLGEFSGVATATPLDQSSSAGSGGFTSLTATNPAADVAFGDLVVLCGRWRQQGNATATLTASLNNGAPVVHAGDSGAQAVAGHSSFDYGIIPPATTAQPLGVAQWGYDVLGTVTPAGGVVPSVVLPAVSGKAYHLAAVVASLRADAATVESSVVQVLDGVTVIWNVYLSVPAAIDNIDRVSFVGLAIKGTAGNSMTIRFVSIGAAATGAISVGAYLR